MRHGIGVAVLWWAVAAGAEVRVLVDQVGYERAAPHKVFVVEGTAEDLPEHFVLRDAGTHRKVLEGNLHAVGEVDRWRYLAKEGGGERRFWTGDIGQVQTSGSFVLEVSGKDGATATTCGFELAENLLERKTLSNVIFHFKGQRVSGSFERADERLVLPAALGGTTVDLGGGWYDATGDYGVHLSHQNLTSYFNPQQVPLVVWTALSSYGVLGSRKDPNFVEYRRRLLDEGLYGADFLVRMKRPGQSFLESISAPGKEKLAKDREVGNPNWRTQIKQNDADSTEQIVAAHGPLAFQASFRAGGGMAIAALALASTMPETGAFSREQYLRTAQQALDFLESHNAELLNDGKENILDDYCALLAETEVFGASHEERYRAAAADRAARLMARLTTVGSHVDFWRADGGTRPFFHPSDAGMPVIALLRYQAVAASTEMERQRVKAVVRRAMQAELRTTGEVVNPFGYARQLVRMGDGSVRTTFFFPHDTEAAPWWQGEDARLASLASAARMAASVFSDDAAFQEQLETYAEDQLHWILGRNPYDSSMLMGSGHDNAAYMFFTSYQYTSAPGAILNGITSSEQDQDGIAFNEGYAVTGKDEDWRWSEEWLPHAAWYLYAVSLPH